MKKFSFELEQILNLRQFQQEQAQIELGKAVSEEARIQDGLNTLALQHSQVKKEISGSKDFFSISQGQKYFSFLKLQEERLLEDLASAKIVTESKRQLFKEALQKTESLKKLKEQKLKEHRQLEEKEDDDNVDDIVTSSYGTEKE